MIVDDQRSQIDDIKRNLSPALELVECAIEIVAEFEDHAEATQYLVRNPGSLDLIVTDVLWPRTSGRRPRQDAPGLQVIRFSEHKCPEALLVALSLGDENHISIDRDAMKAGAHIVRLHEKDLPGDDGSGWIELGETIARTIRDGRPYAKSPSPGTTHGPGGGPGRSLADDVRDVVLILRRMGQICKPLVARRRGRAGIDVTDEYDLQDLVETVLRTLYDDVRPEERTPSSAGSSSTIDFYVRESALAVEVKVATATHREKQIKEELLVDRNDYRTHASVRAVVAVVFDIASVYRNPRGFEVDLSEHSEQFRFEVIVVDALSLRRRSVQVSSPGK
jgi:hypothetical protein